MKAGSRRIILLAMLANSGIAVGKFVAWMATGASSMLAEAVHSVADTANQALLLWGGAAAARAPTRQHAFGYARERYFWAFVVAMILFSGGSLFAIYEGVHKLEHPEPLTQPAWAVGVLLLGIVLEGYSFRAAAREAQRLKGDASWWSFVRNTRSAEVPVVLLEDAGALIGLALALAGVSLSALTGDGRFDAAATISIGVLLGGIALVLAVEMKSLLIGESARPEVEARILAALLNAPEAKRVLHMRTQHLGPDELLLGAKIEFAADLDTVGLARAIDAAEARVRDGEPIATLIYLEPDVYDPTRSDLPGASDGESAGS